MLEVIKTYIATIFAYIRYVISSRLLKRFPPAVRPIVEVRQGKLRGVTSTLPNGSSYHYFKGVPYAKPPLGELRFKPPVPIDRFYTEVVDCLVDRSACVQPSLLGLIIGKENGLYLNVYTPKLPGEAGAANPNLPVMIWIHGGGWITGSGESFVYDPVYMLQDGVIVVTMNYRLGPLGFLCLPSAGIPGNAGLKDQLLVFKWVHDNISRFGGDPGNVTIYGESAGSMAAYLHYLSPNSRKYFQRVICQSGVAASESSFQLEPENAARLLAQSLGYEGDDDREVLRTLQNAPAKQIIKKRNVVMTVNNRKLALHVPFRPVIEETFTEDSIITELPEIIMKQFDTFKMPLINGCTTSEGMLGIRMIRGRLSDFDRDDSRLVPQLMGNPEGLDKQRVGAEIKRFYFGEKRINKHSLNELNHLMSDNIFVTSTMISAEWFAKYQPNVRHYHYRFSYEGRLGLVKRFFNLMNVKGVCHGDDIFYQFRSMFLPQLPENSDEYRIRNLMIRMWTNFAKYDDPTPDRDDPLVTFKWNPVRFAAKGEEKFDLNCLEICMLPRMIENPARERTELWRNYLQTYRKGFL